LEALTALAPPGDFAVSDITVPGTASPFSQLLNVALGKFGEAAGTKIGGSVFGGGDDTKKKTTNEKSTGQKAGKAAVQVASAFLPPPFNIIGQAGSTFI